MRLFRAAGPPPALWEDDLSRGLRRCLVVVRACGSVHTLWRCTTLVHHRQQPSDVIRVGFVTDAAVVFLWEGAR
jgi:hypothetical protein